MDTFIKIATLFPQSPSLNKIFDILNTEGIAYRAIENTKINGRGRIFEIIELQVAETQTERANRLIGHLTLTIDASLACPKCDSENIVEHHEPPIHLPHAHKKYRCLHCGFRW